MITGSDKKKSNVRPDRTLRECSAGVDGSVSQTIESEELFRTRVRFASPQEVEEGDCVLDREAIFAEVEGDMELFGELVELFLDSFPSQLEDIREGISGQDPSRVREAAHGLKGSVGTFQATTAVELANTLELMGRDGNLGLAQQKLTELEAEISLIRTALIALRMEVAA